MHDTEGDRQRIEDMQERRGEGSEDRTNDSNGECNENPSFVEATKGSMHGSQEPDRGESAINEGVVQSKGSNDGDEFEGIPQLGHQGDQTPIKDPMCDTDSHLANVHSVCFSSSNSYHHHYNHQVRELDKTLGLGNMTHHHTSRDHDSTEGRGDCQEVLNRVTNPSHHVADKGIHPLPKQKSDESDIVVEIDGQTMYQCKQMFSNGVQCCKLFSSKQALITHQRKANGHDEYKSYLSLIVTNQCPRCSTILSSVSSVRQHFKNAVQRGYCRPNKLFFP